MAMAKGVGPNGWWSHPGMGQGRQVNRVIFGWLGIHRGYVRHGRRLDQALLRVGWLAIVDGGDFLGGLRRHVDGDFW